MDPEESITITISITSVFVGVGSVGTKVRVGATGTLNGGLSFLQERGVTSKVCMLDLLRAAIGASSSNTISTSSSSSSFGVGTTLTDFLLALSFTWTGGS